MADARQAPTGRRNLARSAGEVAKLNPIAWTRKLNHFMQRLIDYGDPIDKAAHQAHISQKRARALMTHPDFRRAYEQKLQVLRDNERARNIHYAIGTRDDAELSSPAGRKVRLEAAKWLHGEETGSSTSARVNVSVTNQVIGYVIDLSGEKEPPRVIDAIDVNQGLTSDDG